MPSVSNEWKLSSKHPLPVQSFSHFRVTTVYIYEIGSLC
jgi:hypothetical protein